MAMIINNIKNNGLDGMVNINHMFFLNVFCQWGVSIIQTCYVSVYVNKDCSKRIYDHSLFTIIQSGAKRREWMGMGGMAWLLIVSVDHSLIPYV